MDFKKCVAYKDEIYLSYTQFGSSTGYPILIQHGMIASIEEYDLFAPLIDLGSRLISIARPGYGASTAYLMHNIAEWGEMVAALVERLELRQFDILGMSSGAPYSYAIAHRFPDIARNIFIFSGIPALYDKKVAANWPYELKENASIPDMEKLAFNLFFSGLAKEDMAKQNIKDSMMNNCFGPALDLRIRAMDWGFSLADVHQNVYMQHSRLDEGFVTAEMTARLLPNCRFIVRESGGHFSKELLGEFIDKVMSGFFQ